MRARSIALWTLFAAPACFGTIGGDQIPPSPGNDEFACVGVGQDPGPYLIRRLTLAEYLRTMVDTLGVDVSDLAEQFPAEQPHEGFVNDPVVQITELAHVVAWSDLARQVIDRIADFSALVSAHAECTTFEPACIESYVDNLGLQLFRRPVDETMRGTITPIFEDVEVDGGTFEDAAKLALRAMLQSPWFLYRVEAQQPAAADGSRALDDYEIASRLSYLFWGTSPDQELRDAAAAGELASGTGLAAQVERLLASPQARDISFVYLGGWLTFDRLPKLVTDLNDDMRVETEAVFDRVVWEEGRPLTALFDTGFTIASQELAEYYGLPSPQPGTTEYDLSGVVGRRGILTHGSVLSSGGSDASYVQRGKYILNYMLCTDVPNPPPGVNDTPPALEPGKSQRFHSEQRVENEVCGKCHAFMEPLAWSFSVFDGYGAPIAEDGQGNPLRTDGLLVTPWDAQGQSFADAEEFISLLVAEERLAECMVLKVAQFSLGRDVDEADACTLDAVKSSATGDALTYQNLLRSIAMQPSFRTIRGE